MYPNRITELRQQARILGLFNTVQYDPKHDYKKQRRRK